MLIMDKKTITYLVAWTFILAIFWIFLSGFFKPLLLSFGVISVALVVYVLHRMNKQDSQPNRLNFNLSFLRYILWLTGQIVSSSIEVTKLVWGSNKDLNPAIGKFPIKDIRKKSRVLYANSVTLTPGTLCVDIDDEHVTIHALEKDSLKSKRRRGMIKVVAALTKKKKKKRKT